MFDHLNVVATIVFVFFFALVTVLGFLASRWKAADLDHIHEWGLGGPALRPLDHLVPARRRSLHRLYRDRHSRRRLRHRRLRLLRRALYDHHLSLPLSHVAAAVGGLAQARLHDGRRFRARPLRQRLARARGRADRHSRHHALYRAAARRPGEGDPRARVFRPGHDAARADHHRLRHSRALHLQERPARAGDDRLRQGRDDLHLHHRGDRRHPL